MRSGALGLLGMVLVWGVAFAQIMAAPKAEPEYTLKLSQSQIDTVIMAMTKAPMPYEVIAPVLKVVATQAGEQQKVAGKASEEDKKPTP